MFSEMSQEKNKYCMISHMWNWKIIQMNVYAKQTHRYRKQTCGYQREEMEKEQIWDMRLADMSY